MASIGDLFFGVKPDMSGFESEVRAKAQQAGDTASQSMGQRIGGGLRRAAPAIFAGVGAAAAGVFAVGAAGAVALDTAMANYAATTGDTAEELERVTKRTNDLYRVNEDSYEAIAATQAALRTDLGLTQDQLDEHTQSFLDFAKVTGQDNVQAVQRLDDVLDAWNLDADRSIGLMDQLKASHEKYGGDVGANADALSRLAPQLQGMNLSVDEGIGLLNLFAASGLDAQSASTALNTAIRNLEPGQTFDDLVKEISSIEDPTLRSQRAIEIFGSRGGVSLAQALRPGIDSLDDFMISQEEATGAVSDASEVYDSAFSRQIKLWIKNIGGMATELVQNLGPGIGGVAAAAPVLGGALRPLFNLMKTGALGAIPMLVGAIGKIGPVLTGLATGPIGIILAAVAGLFLAWQTNFLGIRDIVENVVGWIGDVAVPLFEGAFNAIKAVVETVVGIIVGIIGGIADVVGTVASVVGGFFDFITGGSNTAKQQINAVSTATPTGQFSPKNMGGTRPPPGYALGAWRVPETGPALLHADEMVVPPAPAQALRDWFGGAAFAAMQPAAVAGGDTINVYPQGLMRARSVDEVGAGLRRLSRTGSLTKRRRFDE